MSRFIKNFCALGLCVSASLFASSYALNSAPSDDVCVDNTEVASTGTSLGSSVVVPFRVDNLTTLYVDSSGYLRATGENNNDELGINTDTNRTSFFAMRKRNSTTTSATGTAKASETGYFINPIDYAIGGSCTYVVDSDGAVWGSGYNGYGKLGRGNTTAITTHQVSNIHSGATKIEGGSNQALVQMEVNGVVSIWGAGNMATIGLGSGSQTTFAEVIDEHTITARRGIIDFSCGMSASYVLFGDGTFWYSNANSGGVWTQMAENIKMFDSDPYGNYIYAVNQANHILTAYSTATSFTTLTETPAGTGDGVEIAQIRGAGNSTYMSWGYLTTAGNLYLSTTSASGNNPLTIPTTATVSGVSFFDMAGGSWSGNFFAYLEESTGSMRLWGHNGYGQLGTGNTTTLAFSSRKTIALGATFDANAGIYNTPPIKKGTVKSSFFL